jgi:hypothetical protein
VSEPAEVRPPASGSSGVALLFLRLLGVVYLLAFVSLFFQIVGLVGARGILPVVQLLHAASRLGAIRYFVLPTVFWLDASDRVLEGVCLLGALVSVFLALGWAPRCTSGLLWVLYLSLVSVGGVFLGYQWDNLLLETGLLAVLVAPWGLKPRAPFHVGFFPVLALRFLLFRLMLASGLVKLLSGDPSWRTLTALTFHYETQPLPTWVGVYAAALPLWFHKASCFLLFVVEIGFPCLIFGGTRLRFAAFLAFLFLQSLIALTGNYAFFNLLTVTLCLLLLDDARLPRRLRGNAGTERPEGRGSLWVRSGGAVLLMVLSLVPFLGGLGQGVPSPLASVYALLEPLRSVNAYGLFAVMTKERPEIVVEGSLDGITWVPYVFRFKPGDVSRPPAFVAPHQPRLDWQMWFAALGTFDESPWFSRFLARLLEGSPSVLSLLARDPFGGTPPRYIQAQLYRYHFADQASRARDGVWWTREFVGPYSDVFEKEP